MEIKKISIKSIHKNKKFELISIKKLLHEKSCRSIGCTNIVRCKGLCTRHYNESIYKLTKTLFCIQDGCKKTQKRRKLCDQHLHQLLSLQCRYRGNSYKCEKVVFKDDFCIDHYLLGKTCIYNNCKSTEIYVKSKELCRVHYRKIFNDTIKKIKLKT